MISSLKWLAVVGVVAVVAIVSQTTAKDADVDASQTATNDVTCCCGPECDCETCGCEGDTCKGCKEAGCDCFDGEATCCSVKGEDGSCCTDDATCCDGGECCDSGECCDAGECCDDGIEDTKSTDDAV